MPADARVAHALAYVHAGERGWQFPLTLRPDSLREHAGQVSFPGGRPERGESGFETARREAHEEIGLPPGDVRPLGRLAPIYIPPTHTRLVVHVATGSATGPWTASPDEVAAVADVPLSWLLDPARRAERQVERAGRTRMIPWFRLPPFEVWGATAIALADLAGRLETVIDARG